MHWRYFPEMDSKFTKQEIESHSSNLFNQRVDNLFRLVSTAELEANNSILPSIQVAIAYHSTLFTLYLETNEAYDTDKDLSKAIEKLVTDGERVVKYLRQNPTAKQQSVEWLIQNCKQLRYLMHRGLQNLKYFFRFGQSEPRSIKEILAVFNQDEWKKE